MLVRAISAFFGILFIYFSWFFFKSTGLVAVCSLVTLAACYEFAAIFSHHSIITRSFFLFLSFCFYLTLSFYDDSIAVCLLFLSTLAAYFILFDSRSIEKRASQLSFATLGLFYCGAFTSVVALGILSWGAPFFIALLLVSFTTDTFAYFGGRLFGRIPMAPKISPNKTIEGGVTGLAAGAGVTFFYLSQNFENAPVFVLAAACLLASFMSQLGDLFESMIKRNFGVKDSGKILPGHGGALDRIDGLLFAAPIIYAWMSLYGAVSL